MAHKIVNAFMLTVCLLTITFSAQANVKVPPYSRIKNPTCSCSCENKIIYQRAKITYDNLLTWAKEAAVSSYSYGFGNYDSALKKASQYYTPGGWQDFAGALERSGNLDIILKKHLIVSAIAAGEIESIKQVDSSDNKVWQVKLPLLVKYQSTSGTVRETMHVTLKINKMGNTETTQDLGISEIVVDRDSKA